MNAWAKVGTVVAVLLLGFGAGWIAQGVRKDLVIADMKLAAAIDGKAQAEGALQDLVDATKTIKDAAAGAKVDNTVFLNGISSLKKDLKNAQVKSPLPPGCAPTPDRLRAIGAAVDAANAAAARPVSGK